MCAFDLIEFGRACLEASFALILVLWIALVMEWFALESIAVLLLSIHTRTRRNNHFTALFRPIRILLCFCFVSRVCLCECSHKFWPHSMVD